MALLPGAGARAAPPRPGWGIRPPDERAEGEAERVGRKRATPSKTDGLVGQTVALPALPLGAEGSADLSFPTRRSGSRSFPLQEAQAQAPPLGEAGPSGEPAPSLWEPIGTSPWANLLPAPRPEPFRSGSAHSLQVICMWPRVGLTERHRFPGWGASLFCLRAVAACADSSQAESSLCLSVL